ncbi:hypothetical protein FSP39_015286 [Pinctada imbricata]|uniref:Antistasin-like domain-containing protein n=1 Tax=Pinctada imbricata TaxID=66713 RepID=A0AA88Y0Q4_PINIB|nr:hypothetical protein FSP39_015286 [Pinctada imbricata]
MFLFVDSGSSGSGMQSPFSASSMGGSPFNQGPSLFQNPYSASMSGGGFQMSPMMAMSGGRSTLPSMFMHGGTLMMGKSSRKCLKNIVCPSYCHEIDEHGCETCPCGPANGINPPGKEEKQKDKQQDKQSDKKDSQCTQTLLCMLSCKDGYELGQKGKDGCQTCKCTKSKGMKLVHKENTDKSCPLTDICIKSCRYELKLGKKGNDGCPSCACVKNKGTPKTCDDVIKCMLECDGEYTLSESRDSECPSCTCNTAAVPTLVHKETSTCEDLVVKCMKDCRNGYHLQAVPGRQCPSCKCLPPPPTAAPVPQKTNVYDLLHECPATINCMTNCKSGYDLQTAPGQHCPVCSCNTAVVATLTCVLPLTCRNGCVYGYKRGPDGCPTCSCIEATAVGLSSHTAIYVQSSVSCNAHFSCGSQCEHGYVSGSNKCPSCQCLVPVTGMISPIRISKKPHKTLTSDGAIFKIVPR